MNRNPPRLVFVLRSLRLGGAERQATLLANHLHESRRAAVQVVAFEPGAEVLKVLAPDIPLRVLHPGSGPLPVRMTTMALFVLGLRRLRPDLLLPFTDWPNKVVNACWSLTGARASLWNQRDEGREVTGAFMERRALDRASWFVANSPSGIDFLRSRFQVDPDRITLIPNSVETLETERSRNDWRRDLGLPPETPIVTMAAALTPFKDHETLLRSWAMVVERRPGATLLLAGRSDGDAASKIRGRAAGIPNVHILGPVDDIGGLLAASDVLVHSSDREGLPNAVLEGMAAGLPVVATDLPGTRMALGNDAATLVRPQDPTALAESILLLILDPDLRRRLGRGNRDRAARLFSQERVTQAWMTVIQALLDRRDPEPTGTFDPDDR